MPIADNECSLLNSFNDGCSDTKNIEFGGEDQCINNAPSDDPSPQNHGTCITCCFNVIFFIEGGPCGSPNCRQSFERVHHSRVEADEGCCKAALL